MMLFCPYASDICIHKTLEKVDCQKCIWSSYGHNAEDFEDTEEIDNTEDDIEVIEILEEDYEALFTNCEDYIPLSEDELPY